MLARQVKGADGLLGLHVLGVVQVLGAHSILSALVPIYASQ